MRPLLYVSHPAGFCLKIVAKHQALHVLAGFKTALSPLNQNMVSRDMEAELRPLRGPPESHKTVVCHSTRSPRTALNLSASPSVVLSRRLIHGPVHCYTHGPGYSRSLHIYQRPSPRRPPHLTLTFVFNTGCPSIGPKLYHQNDLDGRAGVSRVWNRHGGCEEVSVQPTVNVVHHCFLTQSTSEVERFESARFKCVAKSVCLRCVAHWLAITGKKNGNQPLKFILCTGKSC